MKIFNKNNFWWKNIEKNWVIKDKSGDWWIFKGDKPLSESIPEPRNENKPSSFSYEQYFVLILSVALGSLLAFVISILTSM